MSNRGRIPGTTIRTMAVLAVIRGIWRWWSGAHLDGIVRTDATWFRRGTAPYEGLKVTVGKWAYLPRFWRASARLGFLVAPWALIYGWHWHHLLTVRLLVAGPAVWLVFQLRMMRKRGQSRAFRRLYVEPLAATVAPVLGMAGMPADSWLRVDPEMQELAPRLAKEMTTAEKKLRTWYGTRVEPVIRWTPEHTMRAWWTIAPHVGWLTKAYDAITHDQEERLPGVEIQAKVWVAPEIRAMVNTMVSQKLGLGDLVQSWNSVGPRTIARWHVQSRPPENVGLAEIEAALASLLDNDHEFVLGLQAGGIAYTISLDDDSPHIAVSAGSGAGKSVLAMLIAVQVLRRGGVVVILDLKGSHRWARGIEGIIYCTTPAEMQNALIVEARLAEARNSQAIHEADDWNPGPRHFIIFEEMNATTARIKAWWDSVREKNDPKIAPGIQAFRELMYMGRSAKCNLLGIAQMLTANTTGGPESRENFGIRCLARYTKNNWKMLVPECAMPRAVRTRGRWQIVSGGDATAVQVAFLTTAQARLLAVAPAPVDRPADQTADDVSQTSQTSQEAPLGGSDRPGRTPDVPDIDLTATHQTAGPADPLGELVTLREAVEQGIVEGKELAVSKRIQRAANPPAVMGKKGNANLFRKGDLIEFDAGVKH